MTHLLLPVGQGGTVLDQQASKSVAQVVEPDSPQSGFLHTRKEVAMHEVRRVENCPSLRWEYQIVGNAGLPGLESSEEPRVA